MGGGLTAVAPDYERAVLGVPAMNYSTLLRRSSDFAPYAEGKFCGAVLEICEDQDTEFGLYDNYPNELERPLILSMVQMLWDRGEANGYAHHITTDPLADTPAHKVLMHVAFGDHQVTNVAADVEARTIGASTNVPSLDPGPDPRRRAALERARRSPPSPSTARRSSTSTRARRATATRA